VEDLEKRDCKKGRGGGEAGRGGGGGRLERRRRRLRLGEELLVSARVYVE
jgi:hypothetical protein